MSKIIEGNESNFQEVTKDGNVLVEFWASWCGPCRQLGPVLEDIAEEKTGTLKVVKVNVDENPALSAKFDVSSIPNMILFKDGAPTAGIIGAVPKPALLEALEPLL